MTKTVKREPGTKRSREDAEKDKVNAQATTERRALRSQYLAIKNLINDERDDISRLESDKFKSIIGEVESLYQHVHKPREQVVDAEALLDITNTLVTSVSSHGKGEVTPSEFVTSLLGNFGTDAGINTPASLSWMDVGKFVSLVFSLAPGMCTMIGPLANEMKQRKTVVRRKQTRPTENTLPEQIDDVDREQKTDTDMNMSTMFDILRKNRRVRFEELVLNRTSFAQTVENIFALSFLFKDGRAQMTVDDNGHHLVSPRNAPTSNALLSKDVSYKHFVFRFDFEDWKLMMNSVQRGKELMPHRNKLSASDTQTSTPTTPIRKFSRNRGLVMQELPVDNRSPEDNEIAEAAKRKSRRLMPT